MKRTLIILLAAITAASCMKPSPEHMEQELDVNYNNVSGSWKLISYDGHALADGVYQYINFDRKTKEFQEYSNISSQYAVKQTGEYQLSENELGDAVIRGIYTMQLSKEWSHKYLIISLTPDRMNWIAEDDPTMENVYIRADIPEEILAAFPVENE